MSFGFRIGLALLAMVASMALWLGTARTPMDVFLPILLVFFFYLLDD